MEELKKCPFCCGAKLPKRYKVEFSLTDSGDINPLHDDRKRAVEEWNNRP